MKIFFIFVLFLMTSWQVLGLTILIDPGHGGDDRGAETKLLKKKTTIDFYEKDLTLQLSKKIFERLKKKRFNVYLSRSIDRTVSLEERAELAEKIKADLFISIHMNASIDQVSNGFETYYLDNHNSAAVKKVEDVENKNLKGEAAVINQILADLVIERTAPISKKLATSLHQEIGKGLTKKYGILNRGIKPGLFYVLALSKRPSVLLEVGFISNPLELRKLLSEEFQNDYADSVVKGLLEFSKTK